MGSADKLNLEKSKSTASQSATVNAVAAAERPLCANAGTYNASRIAIRRLTYSALFLALALVLPFLVGQIPQIGAMLSPMHIPVLLCGFICGWPYGLAVGFIAPLLRGVLFGMPALMPTGVAMAFELATYGAIAGVLYRLLPHKPASIYIALIVSMIAGRVVWGAVRLIIAGVTGSEFTWALFIAGAITNAIPGIILHIALIPVLVMVMERAGLSTTR